MNNKNSLLFRVFSSKYFPTGNILEVQIPSKCSYAWRSILQSRDVIQKGAVWRVGDGRMIDIWSHNWLPDVGQSRVLSPRNDARVEKVCDLFYPNSKIWDPGLIQHIFYPWEAEKIMRIHVSAVNTEDTLVWPLSPNGEYSVKSTYRMLAAEVTNGLPSSSGGACSLLWKRIWKIHAPQRIKHFIWRAAKDSLPTKQNLVQQKIPMDVTCSLCEDYQEMLLHALWLCVQAKLVWKSDSRFSGLYRNAHRSFVDLLDSIFEQGSVFFVALFSTIA